MCDTACMHARARTRTCMHTCATRGECIQHVCMSEQPQGREAGSQRGQNDSTFADLLMNHLNNSSHIEKYIYI